MMRFKSHQYRGHEDLETMIGLITESRRANGPRTCNDMGQVYFYLADSTPSPDHVNPSIRLWTNESDDPVGYVWFDAAYSSLQVHPSHMGSGVEVEMLDWLEERSRAGSGGKQSRQFLGHCFDNDPPGRELLESKGYVKREGGTRHLTRSLSNPLGSAKPNGYSVRSVAPEEMSSVSPEYHRSYEKMTQIAAYDPELDLVAVLDDGTYAVHYVCWTDSENRVGELHFVKAPKPRGSQAEQAVVLEALTRLKALGATEVVAYAGYEDDEATDFYESCGFETVAVDHGYWMESGAA